MIISCVSADILENREHTQNRKKKLLQNKGTRGKYCWAQGKTKPLGGPHWTFVSVIPDDSSFSISDMLSYSPYKWFMHKLNQYSLVELKYFPLVGVVGGRSSVVPKSVVLSATRDTKSALNYSYIKVSSTAGVHTLLYTIK